MTRTVDVEAIRRDFPILSREVNGNPFGVFGQWCNHTKAYFSD